MNRLELIGYIGNDAEVRETKNGLFICKVRVATNERRKGNGGDWKTETTWHTVTCFGKIAESCGRYGAKGSHVRIEGRLTYSLISGTTYSVANITVNRLEFLSTKKQVKKPDNFEVSAQ
jgi:single-strand DNA-binding protein